MGTIKYHLGVALGLSATAWLASACAPSHDQQVAHGAYLVKVIGCGECHTPGAFSAKPDAARVLAGADGGAIVVPGLGAYAPRNLTPDKATGLGGWTTAQIVAAITKGVRPDGRILSPAMPWNDFANLTDADATDIALYLQSLPAVRHAVPGPAAPQPCGSGVVECVVIAQAPPH